MKISDEIKCMRIFNVANTEFLIREDVLKILERREQDICPKKELENFLCEECGDELIVGKNIHKHFHLKVCKKCRLKLMEKKDE